MHFPSASHQVDIVFLEAVDPVAARFLRCRAGTVRGAEQRGNVFVISRNRNDADTHAEPERAIVPHEAIVTDRGTQRLCRLHRLIEIAALQQDCKLVATEPRERIAPADLALEQAAELVQ